MLTGARMLRLFALASSALALAGCYESHLRAPLSVASDAGVGCDPALRPQCTRRAGPCEPLELVAAECAGEAWSCPAGAARYARPWQDEVCLPLEGRAEPPLVDGVHEAPVPVPIGDRCAWIIPREPDLVSTTSASRCDAIPLPGEPIADLEGALDYAAIQASIVDAEGRVRVLARGWRFDASAPFGVRGLGVGLGTVEGSRIAISDRWLFGEDVDLGDSAIVDGAFAYAFGCPGLPVWLEEDCIVGRAPLDRVDDAGAWSILGSGGWGVGDPVRVFGSGPHRSSVVRDPSSGAFLHVYAVGFGRELRVHRASSASGPYGEGTLLAPCDLPPDDPGAYCAGPVVYRELWDPLEPGVMVVGYSIGTTSEDGLERRARDPRAYWPRIVRTRP